MSSAFIISMRVADPATEFPATLMLLGDMR